MNLAVSGLPPGATASFRPSTVTGVSETTLTIATSTSTPPGNYTLTVSGADASGTNSTTLPLTVFTGMSGVDVYLGASVLNESINQGQTAYFDIFVSGGQSPTFAVNVSGTNVQASLAPVANEPGVYQVIITTENPQTTPGTARVTVTASDSTGTQAITMQLTINTAPPPP